MIDFTQEQVDNAAVDKLAEAMKAKLAKKRAQGYGGWEGCDPVHLSTLLVEHIVKGDPVDVANFCAFLFANGDVVVLPNANQPNQPNKTD